jgi:hypothetical protein
MNETAILTFGLLAACFLAAAWPLLHLPRIRTVLAGAAGSSCLALASATIGVLVSGSIPPTFGGSFAFAADESPTAAQSPAVATAQDAKKQIFEWPTVAAAGLPSSLSEEEIEKLRLEYPSCAGIPDETITPSSSDPVLHAPHEDTVKIPPGRPEWVDADPDYTSKVHTVAVASGPYVHEGESRRALDQAIVKATREYVAEQLGSELAPHLIQYDAKAIKRKLLKADNLYHDVATYSVGPMHEYFALLEFGPEFRNELDRRWQAIRATSRLSQVGLFGGAGLLFLASIFGYFRLDNATRGYYTGRLQFMTAAAILAVVGAGAVLSQWIHWL